jgi:molybdopterin molybdotransferase
MNLEPPQRAARPPPLDRRLPEEAWAWVAAQVRDPATETVALARAEGRVLAQDVSATGDRPPAGVAAIDGYAVASQATAGAGGYNPLPLSLRGPEAEGPLDPGTAQVVVCGQALPAGADAVLSLDDAEPIAGGIEVYTSVATGEQVLQAASEVRSGETLVGSGHRLRPQDLAWLRLLDRDEITVRRNPRVAVLISRPATGTLNLDMLGALIRRDGGQVVASALLQPERADLGLELGRDPPDLVLGIGGTGLGNDDRLVEAFAAVGEPAIRGVAIRPGDTLTLGRLSDRPACLLPGSPLACLAAYDLVAGRLLRGMAGLDPAWPYATGEARLARKIASPLGSLDLVRVRLRDERAEPLDVAGQHLLRSAVLADGFVLVPLQSEGYAEGASVTVYRY